MPAGTGVTAAWPRALHSPVQDEAWLLAGSIIPFGPCQ